MKKFAIICLLIVAVALSLQQSGVKTAELQPPGPSAPTSTI